MAITINGLIAKPNDDTSFTSQEDHVGFKKICLENKAVIVGQRTYDLLQNDPEFNYPECTYFVLRHDGPTAKEILTIIEEKGFKSACIIGGGKTNTAFLKDGLINEIYLDIEPYVFGQGIPLFATADFEYKLELLEVKNLSPQTLQLHYRVQK